MNTPLKVAEAVRRLRASALRVAVVLAGGGDDVASWLLEEAGASRTVLEISLPYSKRAVDGYLGAPPAHYVSSQTAIDLAQKALVRAKRFNNHPAATLVGIGCTAAIKTDRVLRGGERVFVAWRTERRGALCELFYESTRTRAEQSYLAARIVLRAALQAATIKPILELELGSDERLVETFI